MKKIIIVALITAMPLVVSAFSIDGAGLISGENTGLRQAAVNMPQTAGADFFDAVKESGIKIVRIKTGDMLLEKEPGVYDDRALEALDSEIKTAEKHSISLIISLAGGALEREYTEKVGASSESAFFKDAICRNYFKDYIKKITERYADSKAIIAWDLCAGAAEEAAAQGGALYDWAMEMSEYVKSLDKKRYVTINIKKSGNTAFEIFKLPSIDLCFLDADAGYKDGAFTGIDEIRAASMAVYNNVNKPFIVNLSYTGAPENRLSALTGTAKAFFESNGSIVICGGGNTINTEFIETLKNINNCADSIKDKIISASIKNIKAAVSPDSAEISAVTDGDYDIRVMYGEKTPLSDFVEQKTAKSGLNKLTVSGLKPETKYLYCVAVSGKTAGGISKIMEFTTPKTPKLAAVKFAMSKNFIRAEGTDFYDGNKIFRYVGTNNYIMRKYYLDKKDKDKNRHIIDDIFEAARNAGFKVIRVGSNGEAFNEASSNKDDITHDMRIGPDKFNETAYKSIDYVLDSARRHNIRVILHFTDNWEYYGGVPVYTKWAGVAKNDFWTNEACKKYYKQTVDAFVKRKNTVNGTLYKDDPAIFCYDLMNEPRNESDTTAKAMNLWVAEMSAYIKSIDANHMVTTGMEGFFLQADGTHYSGTDFISTNEIPTVDFCTFHIYPASQYTHFSPGTTKWTIDNFIKQGHETVKKPVVMEEYGIPGGLADYPKAQWIDDMTKEFFAAGGNGVNYWMLLDPTYTHGDGNEVYYNQTQYMNIFTKYANEINKEGF
jgi:mannan endo-1,4-beta-mannosidase